MKKILAILVMFLSMSLISRAQFGTLQTSPNCPNPVISSDTTNLFSAAFKVVAGSQSLNLTWIKIQLSGDSQLYQSLTNIIVKIDGCQIGSTIPLFSGGQISISGVLFVISANTVREFEIILDCQIPGSTPDGKKIILNVSAGGQTRESNDSFNLGPIKTGTIYWKQALSIKSWEKSEINIFPNPCQSFVKISGINQSTSVIVSNTNGQIVYNQTISNDAEIPAINWKQGIYWVKINKEVRLIIKK